MTIVATAVVTGAALVLAVEVQLARRGPDLADDTPLEHDGRVGTGEEPALRMAWLGDSTAAGVGASDADHALPRRVAAELGRPVELASLAVSGDRVADVVDEQVPALAELDPDVVLVSIGANDVVHLTSRDDFRSRYEELMAQLPDGALVVLLGVPDMGAPDRYLQPLRGIVGWRGEQLDEVSQAVAREHGAVYVDIAGETGPTMRSDRGRYFAEDRYHPSDDGYGLWADAVLAELQPALMRLESGAGGAPMPVDDVAARGFEAGAAAYEAARPGYPDEAIAVLASVVGIGRGTLVCDLAAGTGKLTRRLLELGARVTAVEPVDAMRAQAERAVPKATHLAGTAEAIPLPDRSVDVVTVAQAFHWFDAPVALDEIARVLRPGGRLAILWNERDESTAWVAEMSRIIRWHERTVSRYQHTDWAAVVASSGRFGPLEQRAFPWGQPITRAVLADRVRSISYIAVMPPAERERLAAEVVALVARRPEPFPLPYQCRVQWCRLD